MLIGNLNETISQVEIISGGVRKVNERINLPIMERIQVRQKEGNICLILCLVFFFNVYLFIERERESEHKHKHMNRRGIERKGERVPSRL